MTHRAFARIGSRNHCRGRRRNYIHHSTLSAEVKPLTGRNLTVIRSMQCELSENVLYRDSYERDPANLYRLSLRYKRYPTSEQLRRGTHAPSRCST